MIPLGDASRRTIHLPLITGLIIAANALMFAAELSAGDAFINRWAFVPATLAGGSQWITVLTAMFMHGGWMHILSNMLFLWVFGPEIEDVMGPIRYLVFYMLGGVTATFAQVVVSPGSTIPSLGASGAIAAVMGAFLITYPRDQIRTILFLGWFARVTLVPAVVLVGIWFLIQVLSEVGALSGTQMGGGVAYMAHIGGFLFGMIVARGFQPRRRRVEEGLE